MTRALCLSAVLLGVLPFGFAACGGNLRPPDPLPTADSGDWPGLFTFSVTGEAPRTYDGSLTLAQSEAHPRAVEISPLCHNGTGIVAAEGFDNVYVWNGAMFCENLFNFGGCFGVEMTYTSARLEIVENVLKFHAEGRVTSQQCAYDKSFTFDFEGRRVPPTGDAGAH